MGGGKSKGKGKGGKGKEKGGRSGNGQIVISGAKNRMFRVKGAGLGLDYHDIADFKDDLRAYEGMTCEEMDFSQNNLDDRAVQELVQVLLGVEIEIISFKLFKNGISDRGAQSSEQ